MFYALVIGSIIGLIVFAFLKIMNLGIELLWNIIPSNINIPFYTIIVCALGGVIIGFWTKFSKVKLDDLEEVVSKVKNGEKFSYDNLGKLSVSAILPLIFGGSIGPEAGLSLIIVSLCSWASDKFKHAFKEIKELTQIGIGATLGTIFNSPLFGFTVPIESEGEVVIPKKEKVVLYFLSIFGAFGIMILLNSLVGGRGGLIHFSGFEINAFEWLWFLPLIVIGIVAGILYSVFNKVSKEMAKVLKKYIILSCLIAGLILGIIGSILPFAMFSGEKEMEDVMMTFGQIGFFGLLITGVLKLFVTNTCISLGLKGGHFFPAIFSGICIGYALSLLININPVFCVCIVTTSLMAFIMKRPVSVIMLLMICFPAKALPVMLLASVIGSIVKLPKSFDKVLN